MDDFLIHANLYGKCKKDVELVVNLLSYFGFEINFAKSCLIPSQKIDFLGYTLDAKNCCFRLTQEKLVKCRLIVEALFYLRSIKVKLLQRNIGFLNFACQLVPLFRSYIRPWYRLPNFSASHRVHPNPGPLVHLWEIFSMAHCFMLGLPGWPNIPCPVLLMPLFLEWQGTQVTECFLSPLSLHVPSLRQNFWHLCMAFILIYHIPTRSVLLMTILAFCIVCVKVVPEILFQSSGRK